MVFSSPFFLFIFLPTVLFLIAIARKNLHNGILLAASLFFYAWGNVSDVALLLVSISINYSTGLLLEKSEGRKAQLILGIAIGANLLLLGYFKYFNFFMHNLNGLISLTGAAPVKYGKVTLPIGISFFTFHALSYVIDVYRKRVKPQRSFPDMALYISFFPQLIAGPIVRYIDIAAQFQKRILSIEKVSAGIQRFIFGLAKKVIIANSMAYIADQLFDAPVVQLSTGAAWLGVIAYTFQIYFDFSGYSDMAIGLAKIFGFDFPENFNYPYRAESIKDFWRKWHISLSTWFRDFLYIPLGGSRGTELRTLMNLLFVFFCTGFWHGASWTFVIWGMFHGTFLLIERIGFDKLLSRSWKPIRIAYTLAVVMIGWVFFRAETFSGAIAYLGKMSFIHSKEHAQLFFSEYIDAKITFILLFAACYSLRLYRWLIEYIERYFYATNKMQFYQVFFNTSKCIISLTLFFITVCYLAGSTYNPFIYFRF
jgi:alginate O-acetyltransferase complex protein AlgI